MTGTMESMCFAIIDDENNVVEILRSNKSIENLKIVLIPRWQYAVLMNNKKEWKYDKKEKE
jgi:hypothetical protein